MSKKLTVNDLEEILGTKERVLFYLTWLKHDRNATKAYLELHPGCNEHSARVGGSRMLSNIDISVIASAYGLDRDRYMGMIDKGLDATKPISALNTSKDAGSKDMDFIEVPDHQTQLKYHDKLGKILGLENNDKPNVQVNIANIIKKDKEEYGI